MSFLQDLLVPHHGNNHKGHLIKSCSLVLLSLVFVGLQFFLNFFLITKPAVLGYSSNISPEKIIELTNAERQKQGLPLLRENALLSEAARQKAADMFAFNYWAHVSPSGRTPWTFFTDVGYKYQYAGENLARDFRDPDSVVRAWMNSPSHKENIVNGKYQEIGIAVVDGSLQGVETTLVVQLFGTPYGAAVNESQAGQPVPAGKKVVAETPKSTVGDSKEVLAKEESEINAAPAVSPLDITKAIAIFVVGILLGAFVMDVILVSHNHTPRLSSRSMAQMLFLIFVLIASLMLKEGAIL
ncbi:MAG: CAP domain-containing protein [Patescibacteria group bacterium]|jgi:hypothetical protein